MDRRNFLKGASASAIAVPLIGIGVSDAAERRPEFGLWKKETVLGETVEYIDEYSPDTDMITFYGRWKDVSEQLQPMYALGAQMSCRAIVSDPQKWADRKDTVKNALKNTIHIKKRNIHVYSVAAPMKHDGCMTCLITAQP